MFFVFRKHTFEMNLSATDVFLFILGMEIQIIQVHEFILFHPIANSGNDLDIHTAYFYVWC